MKFDTSTVTIIDSVCWYSESQANKAFVTLVISPQLKTMRIKIVQPLSPWLKIMILLKLTPILREIWGWCWMVFYRGRCRPVKSIDDTSAVALLPAAARTCLQSLLYGWIRQQKMQHWVLTALPREGYIFSLRIEQPSNLPGKDTSCWQLEVITPPSCPEQQHELQDLRNTGRVTVNGEEGL